MAPAGSIIPLIILLVVVAVLAAVGFVAYSVAHDVGHKTRIKLEKKNVSFSRGGMKVGVKEKTFEQQEDAAQSVITKIWNNSSWPAYKSRLGWGQTNQSASPQSQPPSQKKEPSSRPSSHQTPTVSRHGSSQANLSTTSSAQVH
ncbi:hypothetical protein A1O3_05607 [Capronia epimyces CBS 606.96]|uniref:Uncharacterized protein n=1 Tax=Capronia epimyces CBS 606.96 TaxID=1182542 RepID=W9XWK6_9EURO|nr:uncharacterized protein A1O3_05607 [Capronia epimyces CBS 606.96]EXJ84932.1 hypothetical protein A1O3_05607 [Capronia epimyces CBS 606.96]